MEELISKAFSLCCVVGGGHGVTGSCSWTSECDIQSQKAVQFVA